MTDALSPFVRKSLAVTMLIAVLWLCASVLFAAAGARLSLHREAEQLKQRYADILLRRTDLRSLEKGLLQAEQAASDQNRSFVADNDRAAFSQLQQFGLAKAKAAGGAVAAIASHTATTVDGLPTVAAQLRSRMTESAAFTFLSSIENLENPVWVDELAIASRQGGTTEIEVTAGLRASWLRLDGRKP